MAVLHRFYCIWKHKKSSCLKPQGLEPGYDLDINITKWISIKFVKIWPLGQKFPLPRLLLVSSAEQAALSLQGSHRLEKYLNIQDCLEKSLKIKFALKSILKTLKGIKKSLIFTIFRRIQQCFWRPKSV